MEFVQQPGLYLGYTLVQSINETYYDCFHSGLQTPQYCVSTCFSKGNVLDISYL